MLDEDPYPSLADAFFIAFYFFTGYHLVKNIKYFKKDLGIGPKVGVPVLAIAMVAVFGMFTFETLEDDPTVYFMGLLYVVASAAILSLAILGLAVFRHSVLGIAWTMLVIGIFLYGIADAWGIRFERFYTKVIEVKISRADFHADKNKRASFKNIDT